MSSAAGDASAAIVWPRAVETSHRCGVFFLNSGGGKQPLESSLKAEAEIVKRAFASSLWRPRVPSPRRRPG
jgi:hypothetical protein